MEVDHIRAIAEYDPGSGVVRWKERSAETFRRGRGYAVAIANRWNKRMAGKEAGFVNQMGYLVTCIEKKTIQVHRMAWALHYGKWPDGQIDHINGIKTDNRICNLRDVTPTQNAQNKSRPSTNSSGYIGVHFHKGSGKWHARIMKDGVRRHIGSFASPEEASRAYLAEAKKLNFHRNHGR